MSCEDADIAEAAEIQEVAVAGDDDLGLGAKRTSEHLIIVGIARGGTERRCSHQGDEGTIARDEVGDSATDLANAGGELLAREHVLELGDQCGGWNRA